MIPNLKLSTELKVFVSSKNRLQDDREAARRAIEELAMTPILVEMDKWVASTDRQEWLAQLRRSHLVVLILEESGNPEEDYTYVRQEIEQAAEQGQSLLTFLRRSAEADAPNDLVQEMYSQGFARPYRHTTELADAIKGAVLSEVFRRYRDRSRPLPRREDFYRTATKLIDAAQKRIYLGANSPIVLFGPRYRHRQEEEFFEKMMGWIRALPLPREGDRECVVFFDKASTEREFEEIDSSYDPKIIAQNLDLLEKIWNEKRPLSLLPTEGPHTFAVFDNTYIVWIRSGPSWFGIVDESPQVCDRLAELVRSMGETYRHRRAESADAGSIPARWRKLFEARG